MYMKTYTQNCGGFKGTSERKHSVASDQPATNPEGTCYTVVADCTYIVTMDRHLTIATPCTSCDITQGTVTNLKLTLSLSLSFLLEIWKLIVNFKHF